jgi:hypothetical protein
MVASAMAIYTNLQSKDRQSFLSQTTPSSTPVIEPFDSKSISDIPPLRRAKKITNEKDSQ